MHHVLECFILKMFCFNAPIYVGCQLPLKTKKKNVLFPFVFNQLRLCIFPSLLPCSLLCIKSVISRRFGKFSLN